MSMGEARAFYSSKAWIKCRDGYMRSQHYICERCGGVAVICHHKKYITPANIHDPEITLNWDNLEALCFDCHQREHFAASATREGLMFDETGNLIQFPR